MNTSNAISLNQSTIRQASLNEALNITAKVGFAGIGIWREGIAEFGIEKASRRIRESGLEVTSLCRGIGLSASGDLAVRAARQENERAIDEAHAIGALTLVLLAGGIPDGSRDLRGARARVRDEIERLCPIAVDAGVRLAIEPLHPMYASDRCVVSSLGEALDLVDDLDDPVVGVVVDAFHIWWDARLDEQLSRAGDRILSYQISDWATPLAPDVLLSRHMPGDGVIDLAGMTKSVLATGYRHAVEVEIFSEKLWSADPWEVATAVKARAEAVLLSAR